jgi:FkbM family methyltransferase
VTTRLWGSQFRRPPSLDRWVALQAHRWGLMGGAIRRVLENRVREGMQVADVGANQGIFTLLLSRLVQPSGHVIALEPDATMAGALRANLDANAATNVTVFEAAADAAPGEATLFRSPLNAGDNRLARGELSESCRQAAVRVVRLDDIVPDQRLDFIKIDTQGWEVNVLEGMPACLRANPGLAILFEFWPYGLRQAGRRPADLPAMLFDLGFEIRTTDGARLTRDGVTALEARLSGRRYTDLLAARP